MHILFIGYGKTSQRVAKQLFAAGHQITSVSLSEKTDHFAHHLYQDVNVLDLTHLKPIDCVYILLSPKDNYKATYVQTVSSILDALSHHPVKRLIAVSSTRVYNGHVAQDINDETPLKPNDEKGQLLQQMEQLYQHAYGKKCVIVRPTGIYGTSVARMIKLAQTTQTYTQCHWSNRIHIDDLSNFLASLATQKMVRQSYIASDSVPYPLHEIILWFQQQLGLPKLTYTPQQETGKKIKANHMQVTHKDCFKVYQSLLF